jgi:hypothetical protein
MANKYGKYILSEPQYKSQSVTPPPQKQSDATIKPASVMSVNSSLIDTIGIDFAFVGRTQPSDKSPYGHQSHTHDVDEYIFFIGSNPEDLHDFEAEIEITLGAGEDEEKHIINKASVVYIPKGLPHLPLEFKKVDKPFIWGHILMTPDYNQIVL